MPEPGRPTKLDPEVQERIVQALLLGNHRQDAGIHIIRTDHREVSFESLGSRNGRRFLDIFDKDGFKTSSFA